MTRAQALKEAQRRWGRTAAVSRNPAFGALPYSVGMVVMGMAFMVQGQGKSWEDCFKDADAKLAKAMGKV